MTLLEDKEQNKLFCRELDESKEKDLPQEREFWKKLMVSSPYK